MVTGAVSLPNKMALMELLFDFVCFVFSPKGNYYKSIKTF